MSTIRTVLVSSLCGAALLLGSCGGDDGGGSSGGTGGATTQVEAPVSDPSKESGGGDGTEGSAGGAAEKRGVVTVDGATWEFDMSIVCGTSFGTVTFAGETADGSVGISGGFAELDDDSGLEVKEVRGRARDLQPGADFTIEDGTVTGSGDFIEADQPGETLPGTFEISC